jgi:hypothetical protein
MAYKEEPTKNSVKDKGSIVDVIFVLQMFKYPQINDN